jgi:tetratricopeptide (TPR) repeat protein
VSICRRLDGMPLAIELAAARVRTLPVDAIAKRLDDRFRLLTGGDRAALPRQQTLRALIDWSYELLSEAERAVFRRLAVFAGGWTLEAAEAVVGFDGVEKASVLEHLSELTEKSLVALEADRARYRLLETVREYAQERLAEVADLDETRRRHLEFYLAFAQTARPQLAGPKQAEWLARLDAERENLLVAHLSCDHVANGAERGVKLTHLLRPYWINRGLLGLGLRVTSEALARAGAEARNVIRCSALFDAGQLTYFMGRYDEARRYLEESLSIAREIGHQPLIAAALQPLGMAHLGMHELQGARRYLEEARQLARQRGEERELAAAINSVAQLTRVEGDLQKAEALYEEMLALASKLGDRETVAIGVLNLAMVVVGHGDAERARFMLLGVLAEAQELGSKPLGQSLIEVCAGLASLRQQWLQAARLYGAAEAQSTQTGLHRDPADEAFLRPLVQRALDELGAEAFAASEENGRRLSYEAAITEAGGLLAPAR